MPPEPEFEQYSKIMDENPNAVFVWGSNRQGISKRGAAYTATTMYGAHQGVGEGITGRTYALPTKSTPWMTLNLNEIKTHVDRFISHAKQNPDRLYLITKVGCGLAGLSMYDIAPMFKDIPENCILPRDFKGVLDNVR